MSIEATRHNFKKQFPINLIANIISFALNVLVGIWLVPYYIRHLGVEAFGFVPLATTVTTYAGLVTISLNAAVSRYLVIDLQKKDLTNANKTFNTAFWVLASLAGILLVAAMVFSYMVPRIFNVPAHLTLSVQWLFFAVLSSFLISVFSAVFSVSAFAYNRLDLRNWIDISNLLVRTVLIVVLFMIASAQLVHVGLAYFVGALVSLGLAWYWFRRLTPELRISLHQFDRSKLSELMGMGGWMVLNQAGFLLLVQIDLIACNLLFGSLLAGQYAAILQLNILLRNVGTVFSSIFAPMQLISHAHDSRDYLISLSQRAVKFMALGLAFPVGLLCGFAKPILTLWLGPDYIQYVPLLWILTFHLTVNLGVQPLYGLQRALNRVRWPAIFVIFAGILNVILIMVLVKGFGLGVLGIAIAGSIVLTLRNAVFVPLYSSHILGISKLTFVTPVWKGFFLTALISIVAYALTQYISIDSYLKLMCAMAGICLAFSFLAWKFLLLVNERKIFYDLIGRRLGVKAGA